MTNMLQIKRGIFGSIVMMSMFAFAPIVQAEDVIGGIDMQTFDTQISVDENAHVTVVETITGEFQTPHHGIYRSIPYRYEVDGFSRVLPIAIDSVTNAAGVAQTTSVSKSNGSVVLKIGDAEKLLTGPFTYIVTYDVDRAVLSHDDVAFFSWDAPGDSWEDAFEAITVSVSYDGDVTSFAQPLQGNCFVGAFGSTDTNCTGAELSDDYQSVAFTSDVPMTAVVTFDPAAVVVPHETWLQAMWIDHGDVVFLFIPIAAFLQMFWYWRRHGRDPKGRGVIIPEYDPPKELGPAEVGAVHDGVVNKRDIVAMIVDLAVRGYIVIEDKEGKFSLVKTAKAAEGLRDYEAAFMTTTFGADTTVDLSQKVKKFGTAWKAAQSALYARLQTEKLFVRNPDGVRGMFIAFAGILIALTWFIAPNISDEPLLPFAAGISTALIVLVFGFAMPRRTVHGVQTWEHIQGYKLFLHTAERYRLQWQEREGIFEKYLPYALALGVADAWVKALGSTLTEPPDWYHGNWSTWNALYFMRSMNSFSSAMERSYATATASSRSGGGGFSGGGFGGGGGGGW